MLNKTGLEKYLTECKLLLGADWLKQADETVIGYETVGAIAKRWCIHSFLSFYGEKDCVERLKSQFPEIK